jgi:sugar phosphate isomerase/epimerase
MVHMSCVKSRQKLMKLACSNLAWRQNCDEEALSILGRRGYEGIEVAPTRVWPNWEGINQRTASRYRQMLFDQGFSIPAMQSIFYGAGESNLFNRNHWNRIEQHFAIVAELAEYLECPVLVFGAPRMRKTNELSGDEAFQRGAEILSRLACIAHDRGTTLCIEPNPREYGCQFVWTSSQAVELVAEIDHPGFGLHIDAAAMFMEYEVGPEVIRKVFPLIRHFHISEPYLKGLSPSMNDHLANLLALRTVGYEGWISLESTEVESFETSVQKMMEWRKVLDTL